MPNENEGIEAPENASEDVKSALASLQEKGEEPAKPEPEPKPEAKPEEKPKEEPPKEEVKPEAPKVDRQPTMVEAWKLRVSEDQKDSAIKQVAELQAKVDELSKQKGPVTASQKEEIADDIKKIADESGYDADFLTKFANTILSKSKPSEDLVKTIEGLKQKEVLADQLSQYSTEFETDIAPLVKEKYQLEGPALSKLKSEMQSLAFSETYAKISLKEIFKIKEEELGLQAPKKSSEGKGVKIKAGEVVDLDNLDEDAFKRMNDADVERLASRNTDGWKRP